MFEMKKDDFGAWLEAHDPFAIVGQSFLSWACPIAQWMHERYGLDFCVSGSRMVYTKDGDASYFFIPPEWVGEFMVCLDGMFDHQSVAVQAVQALMILHEVVW